MSRAPLWPTASFTTGSPCWTTSARPSTSASRHGRSRRRRRSCSCCPTGRGNSRSCAKAAASPEGGPGDSKASSRAIPHTPGVAVWSGAIALTRMPSQASSTSILRVRLSSPAMHAAYAAKPRAARTASMLETLTMDPPPAARSHGTAATEAVSALVRFNAMSRCQEAGPWSTSIRRRVPPTLLTSTSRRPRRPAASSIACAPPGRRRRPGRSRCGRPARPAAALARARASLMSSTATAAPMPAPPAVTAAARPSRKRPSTSPARPRLRPFLDEGTRSFSGIRRGQHVLQLAGGCLPARRVEGSAPSARPRPPGARFARPPRAAGSACPRGTSRLTRCSSKARCALSTSPVSSSSIAIAGGSHRGSRNAPPRPGTPRRS